MKIKQSVINTFNRVGIPYEKWVKETDQVEVCNRFGGGCCLTTPLIKKLVEWVYRVNNDYDMGITEVRLSDFDRIRYFILEQDRNVYYTCID